MKKALNDLDDAKRWFQQARFGLFVHWGLYAIPAGEWRGRHVCKKEEVKHVLDGKGATWPKKKTTICRPETAFWGA